MSCPPYTPRNSTHGTSKTLELIVDEYLPLRAVNFEFHNSSNESITLNPTKLTNKILRNSKSVVLGILNLPRLKFDNLNTQAASPITLELPRLKTQLLEYTRKVYKISRKL